MDMTLDRALEAYVDQRSAEIGRSCGSCSLCCRALSIRKFAKPAGAPCPALRSSCSIHAARPTLCRTYACEWLINPDFGDHWRPNDCGMVLRVLLTPDNPDRQQLRVICEVPGAWREEPHFSELRERARSMDVIILKPGPENGHRNAVLFLFL